MKQGFLQSSRYSPGNMSRESLEALFVGHDEIMEDVLSRLMKSVQGPEKHFLLLVGPRGSGKTHFIALAQHRLMDRLDEADAHDEVLVAKLKEEEWGVASFLDLVVRILGTLADQAPSLSTRIDAIYDRFSKDPDEAEAYAIGLLREHAQGKTLMLFCENLLDLFDGLGDEGQRKWRSVIQEDGNWTMVASTPSLFAALTLQDNPFYGFFTIRPLERLDLETALELLAQKAAHEGRPELAGFLRTPIGRARARAIHHLAAGNHRAYVVMFNFLDKESLDELTTPFMHMVDDLTPYYQDRMRQLSPTQRKIVEFLSRQCVPATIKDIAVPSLMSHPTAAKQIGELVSAGFVRRTRIGRNAFCELSGPLMRICMEVKENRTRHFRLFVEFLRHWFTTAELQPDNRDVWMETRRLHILEGEFDAATESAARIEALPGCSPLGRLFSPQAAAATRPLHLALDALGTAFWTEDFKGDDQMHVEAATEILTVSVRSFGPRLLPEGLARLRSQLGSLADDGLLGRMLTGFLHECVEDGFAGSLPEWETALEGLLASLEDLSDCRIPLQMLTAAVKYAKTGDERHLLSLPLEQRQLLGSETSRSCETGVPKGKRPPPGRAGMARRARGPGR